MKKVFFKIFNANNEFSPKNNEKLNHYYCSKQHRVVVFSDEKVMKSIQPLQKKKEQK